MRRCRISKKVHNRCCTIGIDIESIRIKFYPGDKIIGDVSKLPIKARKFDMVLCCEVLEHLNDEILSLAIREILRVAKKYVLITVPFSETLSAQWLKCSQCSLIFHAWGHLRKFDLKTLKRLFKRACLVETQFLSLKEARIPSIGYIIAKKLGNVWGDNHQNPIFCPVCGSEPIRSDGNIFGRLFIRLLWRMEKILPLKKPVWIGCLYRIP